MKLLAKRILITGGTSGVGRSLVSQLAAANELIVVARDSAKLDDLRRSYPSVVGIVCDLSDADQVAALASRLSDVEVACDVMICNAAVQHETWITDPAFDPVAQVREITLNFTSVCQLVSALGPRLHRTEDQSVIALINSGLAFVPKASSAAYCATKAALRSYGQSISYQLEDRGVQVHQAYLPLVDTAMTAGRGTGKISADGAAKAIIAGIEAGRSEHYIGEIQKLWWLHLLLPRIAARIMREK